MKVLIKILKKRIVKERKNKINTYAVKKTKIKLALSTLETLQCKNVINIQTTYNRDLNRKLL